MSLEEDIESLLKTSAMSINPRLPPTILKEETLGDILRRVDDALEIEKPLPVAKVSMPNIDKMLARFREVQERTARACIERAEELEAAAFDMRERAAILVHQAAQIPDDYRHAVEYEIHARERAQVAS